VAAALHPSRRATFAGAGDRVFPTRQGDAQNRHNARQRIVLRTVDRTNASLEAAGRPPLPEGLSPRPAPQLRVVADRGGRGPRLRHGADGPHRPVDDAGLYAKAVRNGRRSARSRRRLEELEWAPTGTSAPVGTGDAVDGLAA
jgi:hypothetical protein